MSALESDFFDKDPVMLAKDLLGKVLRAKYAIHACGHDLYVLCSRW
jgi:3-methyladenine DNA glycosylase Mpg